jgi:ribonuclease P protein component
VGRRIGGAVARNHVKRRLRGLAARMWNSLPEADIAFLARPGAAAVSSLTLEEALNDLLGQAACRSNKPR